MNGRMLKLSVIAFVLGFAGSMGLFFALRFSVVAIRHGGLF